MVLNSEFLLFRYLLHSKKYFLQNLEDILLLFRRVLFRTSVEKADLD